MYNKYNFINPVINNTYSDLMRFYNQIKYTTSFKH